MIEKYTLVFTETGRVHCHVECSKEDLPPEGALNGNPDLIVVHGHLDMNIGMLVDGTPSRLPDEEIKALEERDRWFEFRKRRQHFFNHTDYKMMPDYPLTSDERNAMIAQRKAMRDIPQTTEDPLVALQMLDAILNDNSQG